MTRTAVARAEASRLTVAGLGVAVPGPVETDSGLLRLAPNLGWVDVPVAEILADRLAGLAVVVDNEANLAALGELWFGGHDGLVDFVHVSGEIGVGGGVIVGEELFRGARGFAGEIGHVVVQPDGPRCRCGARGCLEQVAGQEAILRSAGLTGAVGTSIGQPRGSVAELLAGARAGDPGTLRAISEAGRALGIGLSATVNIVDPSTVVLGGLYAALEPWLSKPLLEELSERAITHRWSPVQVLASRLGPDAAVRGAAGTVVKRVLSEPAAVFRATGRHVAPTPPRPD
jgi:predicted NBD/HSP70 family sugar kinase